MGLLSKVFARVIGPNVKLRFRIVTDKGHGFVQEMDSEQPAEIERPQPLKGGNKAPTTLDAVVPQQLNPQLDPKKTFQNYIECNIY